MQLSEEQWEKIRAYLAAGPAHMYLDKYGMVVVGGLGRMQPAAYLALMEEQEMLYGVTATPPELERAGGDGD